MANANTVEPLVYQFRYYGAENPKNYPVGRSWIGTAQDGTYFKDILEDYGAAIKIGIQTLPGVRFFISNSNLTDPIIIDHTGVYELDLRNTTTTISNLYFDPVSLARIDEIDNASLIVDVLCNPKDGTVNS